MSPQFPPFIFSIPINPFVDFTPPCFPYRYIAGRDGRQPCKLITLGFGYSVNSRLLVELADTHGGGSGNDFHFIPDGTMLLTTFVNLMANLESTCARDVVLRIGSNSQSAALAAAAAAPSAVPMTSAAASDVIEAMDALFVANVRATDMLTAATPAIAAPEPWSIPEAVSVVGEAVWRPTPSGGMTIHLGDVLYGQNRTVVLRKRQPAGASAEWRKWTLDLSYKPVVLGLGAGRRSSAMRSCEPRIALSRTAVARELHREWILTCPSGV
jgi:hypothetical protein